MPRKRLFISRSTYDWLLVNGRKWLDANWQSKCHRQWVLAGVIVTADPDTIDSLSELIS